MKRIANIELAFALVLSTALLAAPAAGQTATQAERWRQSSLGDYARTVRKDPGAPKARAEGL